MSWTIDTLKAYFDQRFTDSDKAVSAALVAQEKAVIKAEANAERWRENANEWRAAMQDREVKFATRTDVENLNGKIAEIRETIGTGGGIVQGGKAFKDESRANLAILLSAIGLAAVLIRWLLTVPK